MSTQIKNRSTAFVDYLFQRNQNDKGFAARMRRADNPATEWYSWDTLVNFNVNLTSVNERLPFQLIAAAVSRSSQQANGSLKFGQAIAGAFPDGNQNDQAKMRLRRLLACDNTEEVCRILRPLLSLIQSRGGKPLNYAALLEDLRWFSLPVKARWAQQFYGKPIDDNNSNNDNNGNDNKERS